MRLHPLKMNDIRPHFSLPSLSRRYALLALVWSVLAGVSLLWNLQAGKQDAMEMAAAAVRANIQKDFALRKWVNSHGGVYVSPTEHTPPNPYLNVPERDVVTTTGKALTLMNHAYVLREIKTDFPDDYGALSRIASLHPLNSLNAADAWETGALASFEQGNPEYLEIVQINGQPHLRMMKPLMVEQACTSCHTGQKVGDVRGGISSSIALKRFISHGQEHRDDMLLSHGMIWLIGLAVLGISYRRDARMSAERQEARQTLEQQIDELLRFQKLTVGRELRMKELAEENTALRTRLATDRPDSPPT